MTLLLNVLTNIEVYGFISSNNLEFPYIFIGINNHQAINVEYRILRGVGFPLLKFGDCFF